AFAEEADQASVLADREMTNRLVLHQSMCRLHGGLGRDHERRRCHQVPNPCRRGLGRRGVMKCVSHKPSLYYIAILLITKEIPKPQNYSTAPLSATEQKLKE